MTAKRRGDLYFIEDNNESTASANSCTSEIENWHNRYGHLNEKNLKQLILKNLVNGMSFDSSEQLTFCETCVLGKHSATTFPQKSLTKSDKILELIHSDVYGPMRVQSIGGATYFVTFIDDKSRYVEVFFLKSKSEAKKSFLKFKNCAENQAEKKILRTDNGLEYCGAEFTEEIEQAGIKRQRTVAHTPQQNGIAERMNRTLVEMARCLLIKSKLPPRFWAEAIATSAYIRNRSPSRSLDDSTPFESKFGYKANVSTLRTFGCRAYALNKDPGRSKLDPKSKLCIFVGYCDDSKAYRLWDPETRKIIKSRDVIFNEEDKGLPIAEKQEDFLEFQVYFRDFETNPSEDDIIEAEPEIHHDNTEQDQQESETNFPSEYDSAEDEKLIRQNETEDQQESEINHRNENVEIEKQEPQPVEIKRGPGRPKNIKTGERGRPPKQYKMIQVENVKVEANLIESEAFDPTVEEAINGPRAKEWREAMQFEFDSLKKCNAWTLVD